MRWELGQQERHPLPLVHRQLRLEPEPGSAQPDRSSHADGVRSRNGEIAAVHRLQHRLVPAVVKSNDQLTLERYSAVDPYDDPNDVGVCPFSGMKSMIRAVPSAVSNSVSITIVPGDSAA